MRTTRNLLLLMSIAIMLPLSGCKNSSNDNEILRPIKENLIGTWNQYTQETLSENGEIKRETSDENSDYLYQIELREDNTAHFVATMKDGYTRMNVMQYQIDEDTPSITINGVTTPIFLLTANEFGFSHNQIKNSETGEVTNGEVKWIYKRVDNPEPLFAEKFIGKWNFSKTYEKKNGEWVETGYGIPDEGWYEYKENSSIAVYSRKADKEQTSEMIWAVNAATNEMKYYKDWGGEELYSCKVSFEDDNTINVFYSKNYDPATGKVKEGEFKDVLIRQQ